LGRQPGEALCPERFNEEDLHRIKRQLGSYSFSALYQQRPTPPEGGLFKRQWFKRIIDRAPEGLRWYRGYDLAVSTKSSADYTASVRCSLDPRTGELYIADGFRKRIEYPDQKRYIKERLRTERWTIHGVEVALHGQAFIQEIRRESTFARIALVPVRAQGDKFTKALAWAARAEEGKVILVRNAGPSYTNPRGVSAGPDRIGPIRNPVNFAPPNYNWIEEFLEEICAFPNSPHDDQLDAVSIAVHMIARSRKVVRAF